MNRDETRKAAEVMLHYANGGEVLVGSRYDVCTMPSLDPSWSWDSCVYAKKPHQVEIAKWVWVINGEVHACINEQVAKGHAERSGGQAVELKGTYTCDT